MIVAVFFALSVLLFVSSLTQYGYYVRRRNNPHDGARCVMLLLIGPFGVFESVYAWLANPALLLAWSLVWFRPAAAAGAGVAALALSLSFLLHHQIIVNEAGDYAKITGYGLGYWLWIGSIIAALAGSLLGMWFGPRKKATVRGDFARPAEKRAGE